MRLSPPAGSQCNYLKDAANLAQCYSYEQYFLIVYFEVVYLSLVARHWLGLPETSALWKLTSILQHFANVVGERVTSTRFENLTASGYSFSSLRHTSVAR
jgi:hypothetical protein